MKKIAKIFATAFGTGYAPKAPGTAGSAMGILLLILLRYMICSIGLEAHLDLVMIVLIIVIFVIGVWCTKILEGEWGHDPGKIVIDEVVGVWVTLLFVPTTGINFIVAFILFRFFDILKPLGIKSIDNFKTPMSVMLDDVLAGFYSWVILQGILYLF